MKTCRELDKRYAEATIAFMVTNSFEDFAPEIVEEQLNKKQELEIFTDEFLRPFEEMRALETNEDGTVSLVIFFKKMIQNLGRGSTLSKASRPKRQPTFQQTGTI